MLDSELILKAAHFAAIKHKSQRRKGGDKSPYINHPLSVALMISKVGNIDDKHILAAALLHDTLEDTDTNPNELEKNFGQKVRFYVEEISDNPKKKSCASKLLQMKNAPLLSDGATIIRVSDKICNIVDIIESRPKNWTDEKCLNYLEWSNKIVNKCRTVNVPLENYFMSKYKWVYKQIYA
jgi:guanosine-3',5'-bis(diphosphate) 3'-pyrophosphohydrolase